VRDLHQRTSALETADERELAAIGTALRALEAA
jgi:hypothetical protein